MDGYIVSVQNFIAFGFSITCFFISPTSDGDVNIDIQIAHESFFAYGVIRYLICCYMLQSLHMLYNQSCMLLYAHKFLHNMKVMAVEEVPWCVSLILF